MRPWGRLLLLLVWAAAVAQAHEVRPGYLEVRELADARVEVLWKVPVAAGAKPALRPRLPATCAPLGRREIFELPAARVTRWQERCPPPGLAAGTITVEGLDETLTDVLLRVHRADGLQHTALLRPSAASFEVPPQAGPAGVAAVYLRLGVEHIALGLDHLLFLFGLLLLVRGGWRLVRTITAFTLAHSVTLALAVLGVVQVPAPPVEAVIALSILFLALELVDVEGGRPGLTRRYPWRVAFAFGLLHGLGFAGALGEIGLPAAAIPQALLWFNVGVEIGQIVFVAAALAVVALARRGRWTVPMRWRRLPAYGLGVTAVFWCCQRLAGFWVS